jgi:hypothetical protein
MSPFSVAALRFAIPALIMAVFGCQTLVESEGAAVAPDVRSALRTHGEAHVVVALVSPLGYDDPLADRNRVRAEIARLQQEVLASLDPRDYRSRHLLESVPAMSGTLLSERGLSTLLSHPHVRRVDLDAQGGGTDTDP